MNDILVESLTKTFNGFTAVDAVSFAVGQGELFGLLGPNGAGKTTTISMLATLLRPTSGRAEVAGIDVLRDRNGVRRNIGVVFQEPALDGKLTGRENLEFHAMMYGLRRDARKARIRDVLELVELEDWAGKLVEKYSGGMRRRLEIARGLMHRPRVLFLDEPTLGLDAQTRRHIREYIGRLNREDGVTIVLTTHDMEEADALCGRVAIMDHGRFAAQDTPARLKDLLGGDAVLLEIDGPAEAAAAVYAGRPWVAGLSHDAGTLTLTLESADRRIPEILALARDAGFAVRRVELRKPSLEDVFLRFTGRSLRDREAGQHEKNRSAMTPHWKNR